MKHVICIFSLLIFVFISFGPLDEGRAQFKTPDQCVDAIENLTVRLQNLEKIKKSIESLMGSGSTFDIPLSVLFQLNMSDVDELAQRKVELANSNTPSALASNLLFVPFQKCEDLETQRLLVKYLDLYKEVNFKKLSFLQLNDDERNSLIAAYESQKLNIGANQTVENQLSQSKSALNEAQISLQEVKDTDSQTKAILDQKLVDLETEHLGFIEKVKTNQDKLNQLLATASQLSRSFLKLEPDNFEPTYSEVTSTWEVAVDNLLNLFSDLKLDSSVVLVGPNGPVDFSMDLKPGIDSEIFTQLKLR
jgi:hypothetical protein